MKLTRPVPMWQQVADHVRDEILNGTYQPGQPLPSEEALSAEFGVSRPTIREGIKTLVAEGLVEVSRPRGTIVRDPFGRPTRTELHNGSTIREDDGWTDVGEPTFYRANATIDQADLLGIPAGEPLLVRAVIQQSNGLRRANRLYLPFSMAASTPWADNPHLPSAIELYDHFAHAGHTLTWTEYVRARMPIGDETIDLEVPPGVPLLIVLRLTAAARGGGPRSAALALQEIRHRADQTELEYSLA
jgi:GntR family transcriptional regulator